MRQKQAGREILPRAAMERLPLPVFCGTWLLNGEFFAPGRRVTNNIRLKIAFAELNGDITFKGWPVTDDKG